MATRPLRILVVDDDPAMVGAITALVGTEGHQVITAYDGLTAVKRFREEHPDLVLLDLAMPGPDGFTVAGQIRAAGQAPILVVSGESGEAAKVRALGIGADDYLTKPFGKAELLARIAAIMRRVDRSSTAGAAAGGPLQVGDLQIEPGRHEARIGDRSLTLTPTEFRLLEALVRAGGDIVPHHRLARAGWPAEHDPDLLWLKPHLARLRSKVESAGGPEIVAVRGVGYRIVAENTAAESAG
ncbi:MAG: response regulator transcription factor [Chloroflexota bacterium]